MDISFDDHRIAEGPQEGPRGVDALASSLAMLDVAKRVPLVRQQAIHPYCRNGEPYMGRYIFCSSLGCQACRTKEKQLFQKMVQTADHASKSMAGRSFNGPLR